MLQSAKFISGSVSQYMRKANKNNTILWKIW